MMRIHNFVERPAFSIQSLLLFPCTIKAKSVGQLKNASNLKESDTFFQDQIKLKECFFATVNAKNIIFVGVIGVYVVAVAIVVLVVAVVVSAPAHAVFSVVLTFLLLLLLLMWLLLLLWFLLLDMLVVMLLLLLLLK